MKKIQSKMKALEWSHNIIHQFLRCSRAANSIISDGTLTKFKLIQAFIVVLLICKNEDQFKIESTRGGGGGGNRSPLLLPPNYLMRRCMIKADRLRLISIEVTIVYTYISAVHYSILFSIANLNRARGCCILSSLMQPF